MLSPVRLDEVLNTFAPGDGWTWEEEFEWLEANHAYRLISLGIDIHTHTESRNRFC